MLNRKKGKIIGHNQLRYSVLSENGNVYQSQITSGFSQGQPVEYTGPNGNKVVIYPI